MGIEGEKFEAGISIPKSRPVGPGTQRPLGQILLERGDIKPKDLVLALGVQERNDARLGDILLSHGLANETVLYEAIAQQYGSCVADFTTAPPDPRLIDRFGAIECLKRGLLPWRTVGGQTVIATCRPEEFAAQRPYLDAIFGRARLAIASESSIHAAIAEARRSTLVQTAETRVAPRESCRAINSRAMARYITAALSTLLAAALVSPHRTMLALVVWGVIALLFSTVLKLAAVFAQARRTKRQAGEFRSVRHKRHKRPVVSVMVPLFRERDIAGRLVKRLSLLTYPSELLDILLVVEEDDHVTRRALSNTELPRFMRQIVVPRGGVKTKPRALNYALDFCRGSIIGVYDAEDAPDPDQIDRVVKYFTQAPKNVACLQGVLDFYNTERNWLSRCFTVEYASWFRAILPGYQELDLVIPLGGTTLFFRRDILEKVGGWDAHNVTEDADLGVRLARYGYRTELIPTVTQEEANCRTVPWIKQRSRWLKGYAMTWIIHMRAPRQLFRELGPKRFLGFQIVFLGTLSQIALAPLLWSFWALPLGLPHPLLELIPRWAFWFMTGLFVTSEAVTVAVGLVATSRPRLRRLWGWVPTLHFYFPLATLAIYKALWELIASPYYWDKTAHGSTEAQTDFRAEPSPNRQRKPPVTAPMGHIPERKRGLTIRLAPSSESASA